jgi:hypothetical protein
MEFFPLGSVMQNKVGVAEALYEKRRNLSQSRVTLKTLIAHELCFSFSLRMPDGIDGCSVAWSPSADEWLFWGV